MKKDKNAYQFAEKCLYEYKKNLARREILLDDLRALQKSGDVKAQQYVFNFSIRGAHSDPVEAHYMRIENLEKQIENLRRITEPITKMLRDLRGASFSNRKKAMLLILELYYFKGCPIEYVARKIRYGRSLFFELKRELVYLAMEYLGLGVI